MECALAPFSLRHTCAVQRNNNGEVHTHKSTPRRLLKAKAKSRIPYAKPPIGQLRFSIPEPPEPWEDVRDATNECNICIQYDKVKGTIVGDEDCLYLNVYSPQLENEGSQLPVMEDDISDTDKLVRERMITMWTNFAKYSNPTPDIDDVITTKWEPTGDSKMAYLFIDDKLTMKTEPYPARTKLYEELYKKYENL
ncbi:unnamed protein product, partial [Iphiclides podalirius]